jgi:hypothetical protein
LECWLKAEQDYDCYSDEKEITFPNVVLLEEVEEATKNSELLGEEFISSCQILVQFRSEYVRSRYGNSPCSFTQLREFEVQHKACEESKIQKTKYLSSIATSR